MILTDHKIKAYGQKLVPPPPLRRIACSPSATI